MRKLCYRFIVLLATFALGVAASFYFQHTQNVSRQARVIEASTIAPTAIIQKPVIACRDELLRQISGELMSDEDFVHELTFDNHESFNCADNFRIESIDLNGDRRPEFVVQGSGSTLCSPTGNCHFWIYRKVGRGYEKIMEAGDDVQQYYFQRTFSDGYRDVMTAMHSSAFDSDLSVYRFDGNSYRLAECGLRSYSSVVKGGRLHLRQQPLITLGKCDE